jgi:serine/threonine protein kinase
MMLVTEYCKNGSLFEFLVSERYKSKLTPSFKAGLISGCADGLRYLHGQKLLHRDFKSPNVLLDADFNVKICDFGLSDLGNNIKIINSEKESRKDSSKPFRVVGSIAWVAPEIFAGATYTEISDIYSFGIVCWEIVYEQHPYQHEINTDKFEKIDQMIDAIRKQEYRPEITDKAFLKSEPCFAASVELINKCLIGEPAKRGNWGLIYSIIEQAKAQTSKFHSMSDIPKKAANDVKKSTVALNVDQSLYKPAINSHLQSETLESFSLSKTIFVDARSKFLLPSSITARDLLNQQSS